MREVQAGELRGQLADLLNRAHYGKERCLIVRRGKSIAALVPIEVAYAVNHPNRIVIRVEGGNIQGAHADDPTLEVIVVDDDNIEAGDPHPFGTEAECARVLSEMHPVY